MITRLFYVMIAVSMILPLQSRSQDGVKYEQKEAQQSEKSALPQPKFEDRAGERLGSTLYHKLIPDSEKMLEELIAVVVDQLYFDDKTPMLATTTVKLTLLHKEGGIAETFNRNGRAHIVYSTDWIEKFYENNGRNEEKLLHEIKGVIVHELVHVFQLQPKGIGTYGDGGEYWLLIESLADAIRVAAGYFGPDDRPRGGNFQKGYRYSGFFLNYLRENNDKDFLRKLNLSTLDIEPWSFDKAFKQIFGDDEAYTLQNLWDTYMVKIGDKQI